MGLLVRRLVVIGIVGIIAFIAAVTYRERRDPRFAAARERATRACRAFRSMPEHARSHTCRPYDEFGPRAFEIFRRAEKDLERARADAARGDTRAADADLARALTAAHELDRLGLAVGTLMSAKTVDRVLDLADEHPELYQSALTRGEPFEWESRPLEGERLHHGWTLAHWREDPRAPVRSEASLASSMELDEADYRAMERAVLAGDKAACARSAREISNRGSRSNLPLVLCEKLADVGPVNRRLERARRRAP